MGGGQSSSTIKGDLHGERRGMGKAYRVLLFVVHYTVRGKSEVQSIRLLKLFEGDQK